MADLRLSSDEGPSTPPGSLHRRTSSDATPRASPRPLHDSRRQAANAPGASAPFAQHLLAHQLPPRSHSRAETSATSISSQRTLVGSQTHQPAQISPQKPVSSSSTARTYDSKLVSREMHRLGTLAQLHTPASNSGSTFAPAASVSSLALPVTTGAQSLPSPSSDNPWQTLHVHVLPLFNGDPLRIPIEDLNGLVKRHLNSVVSRSPSRALSTLEADISEFVASGMMTLNAKLAGLDDDKLLGRVVDLWGFFWDQILPYVEGVFLPLQTDAVLLSLSRTPKSVRPSSPTQSESTSSVSLPGSLHIDVRKLALRAFRDAIILPLFPRLNVCITSHNKLSADYHQPRLQQMLLVLISTAHHSLFLGSSHPHPNAGEQAVTHLLRAVRQPVVASPASDPVSPSRIPTFLAGSAPRDRRGRVARKSYVSQYHHPHEGSDDAGDETPRNGSTAMAREIELERERESEFLESLRSPALDGHGQGTRDAKNASRLSQGGGWGLGDGRDEQRAMQEDDDELMDTWDDAQSVVERMVGFRPPQS